MTEPAKCPNCGLGADGDDIEKKFGFRISNNRHIVQLWCKLCRNGKEIIEEETPEVNKKKQVIILGAGVTGLSAGVRFLENGCDVCILSDF